MRTLILLLLALAAFCTQSFAQAPSEYTKLQKQGVDAANAGKLDEGIAAFKKCLELVPEDATTAYNLGCCYSKKAEKDPAFEWLDKSVGWGFGNLNSGTAGGGTISNIDFSQQDTDLSALHEDPRWAKFIEKMTLTRKALEEFTAQAAVYIPKALEGAAEFPVLVVLHAERKTKNSVIEGRWKRVADALGCALIAPSGKLITKGIDPTAGMDWFDSTLNYQTAPRAYERSVSDALIAFQKDHKLVAERVFIAGEGTGAMLAFNIALTKPAVYRGVLVVDGLISEKLATSRVAGAAKAGLRVHAIESKDFVGKLDAVAQTSFSAFPKKLLDWGFVSKVETYEFKAGESDPSEVMILVALKAFSTPAPVEAGKGK